VHEGAVASPPGSAYASPERRGKGASPFTVWYSLPLDAFAMARVEGKWTVQCGAAVIAFNNNGTMIAHRAQQVTFALKDDAAAHPAGKLLPVNSSCRST
jgi:hypothetical protein